MLFLNTPRKVNNDEYGRIGLVPIEESLRGDIGAVVEPDDLPSALPAIDALCGNPEAYRERLGASVAAEHLIRMVEEAAVTPTGQART